MNALILLPSSFAVAAADEAPVEAKPTAPAPANQPELPAEPPPPPPDANAQPQQAPTTGQWVFTSQYGWVWMPYGDEYVYTPADEAAQPFVYVYAPARGWAWLAAPWIWGVGPVPHFGALGPWHFHWYRGPHYYMRYHTRPLYRGGWRHGHGGRHH
jgi:hypothetical protein